MWKPFVDCKPNRKMFQLSKCFIKNKQVTKCRNVSIMGRCILRSPTEMPNVQAGRCVCTYVFRCVCVTKTLGISVFHQNIVGHFRR